MKQIRLTAWRGLCVLVAAAPCLRAQEAPPADPDRLTVLPVLGSAPETGVQYGATVGRLFRRGPASTTRTSMDLVFVAYTSKDQLKVFLQRELWTRENAWRLTGRLEYTDFPTPYFGVGDDAPEAAEEWYTARAWFLEASAQRKVRPALFVSGGYRVRRTTIEDLEPDGALAVGDIDGVEGGTISQVVGGLIYDTRDNTFAAHRGALIDLQVAGASRATGSDFTFGRYTLDARAYRALARGYVAAAQVFVEATSGRPSFDQLSLIGTDTHMRGYVRGRYRERNLAATQVELRTPYWKRLGVVAFAGGGVIADELGRLGSGRVLPTYGAGVRYLLFPAERSAIRVDFGVGRGSNGLYVSFAEAF